MSLENKQKTLEKLGADTFYIVQFDAEFASLSPEQFVLDYLIGFGAKQVVAGFDFTYGYRGKGNMDRILADSNGGIEGIKVGKVEFNGEKISSTLIRELINLGKVEQIYKYLGKPYQTEGKITLNKKNGEVLVHSQNLLPGEGIYEVKVSNGRANWKQVVLVSSGAVKLILPKIPKYLLAEHERLQITWNKRLQNGLSSPIERKYSFSNIIVS